MLVVRREQEAVTVMAINVRLQNDPTVHEVVPIYARRSWVERGKTTLCGTWFAKGRPTGEPATCLWCVTGREP